MFLAEAVPSQTFRFNVEPGYGFYNLGKLHQAQDIAYNLSVGLGVKSVEKFPPFFNQSGSISWYATPNFLLGVTAGFLSTGGRNSAKDYSGDYKLDMLVNATLYGLETEYNFRLMHNLKFFLNVRSGEINSTLNLHENFVVTNTTLVDDSETYKESNLFVEPSTGIRYNLNKSFSLSMGVGYLFDFNPKQEKSIDWSGYRLKAGVAYSL